MKLSGVGLLLENLWRTDRIVREVLNDDFVFEIKVGQMGQNELNLSPSMTSLFKSVLIVWEIQ